jgi:MFS superfamily sulfate permease-like transporter
MPLTLRNYHRAWLASDLLAGVTLAAVAVPECMGYTKIAGTPVITGLYTMVLPLTAFALIGSSRHLVIGADSATAAILFAGLTSLATPFTDHWAVLASGAALLTAACLGAASLFRLGFLADFLSRTVLVGFLSGVGVSLVLAQLPDMLGIPGTSQALHAGVAALIAESRAQWPTMFMALAVLGIIVLFEHAVKRVPGPLVAIALAIGVTWWFDLNRHGIAVVGSLHAGLPTIRLPALTRHEAVALLPTCASMFFVIVAQSAATARSFAHKYGEPLDEDRDLFALTAANVLAGLSSTFVVNGSPTKTAIVDAAGSRTQLAQLTTAVAIVIVLLTATSMIERLPVAALAALVFVIGVKLIDLRSLREIYYFRTSTFLVALATLCAVVWLGVERGIFVAMGLSILDHLRQEYHPKDVVLIATGTAWRLEAAVPGVETAPGLVVYRFEAPLFFANADYFAARVRAVAHNAPHPVRWFALDLMNMENIDYTGGLTLAATIARLQEQGITVVLTGAKDVLSDLGHLRIPDDVGLFESAHDALVAYLKAHGESSVTPSHRN